MFSKRKLKVIAHRILNRELTKPLSRQERYAVIIVNKLLCDPDSDMLMHPSMDRYYIKCEPLGMFVVMDIRMSEVSIINHVYSYHVKMSRRAMDNVLDKFVSETEKRRLAMEKEYTSNIQFSLRTVSNNITENRKRNDREER